GRNGTRFAGHDRDMSLTDELIDGVEGPVFGPGDDGYQDEIAPMNLAMRYAPSLVVGASSAADVQAAVRFAAARALPVGVLNSGHGPSVPVEGGVLITTHRMTGVEVDPQARTARVAAGTRWRPVVEAAAEHGLAPLAGSSETVGVVGYLLGGGLSIALG